MGEQELVGWQRTQEFRLTFSIIAHSGELDFFNGSLFQEQTSKSENLNTTFYLPYSPSFYLNAKVIVDNYE